MESIRKKIHSIMLLEYTKEEIKSQVEVIYKDANLVCLIPKSQMTSSMYGQGTEWCQVSASGFEDWSRKGLLIRFLFKSGRRIRFTYFFPKFKDIYHGDYYWANENGYHVLTDTGNPFEAQFKGDRVRDTEKDILNLIKQIPQECQNRVLNFLEKNKEAYDYCYSNDEFRPTKIENTYKKFLEIYNKYKNDVNRLDIQGVVLHLYYDKIKREIVISHGIMDEGRKYNQSKIKKEIFREAQIEQVDHRMAQLVDFYSQKKAA
jgi:hypothetical protein